MKKFMGLFGKDIALDLGTANTLIYTREDGIILNEPSVIAIDNHTDNIIAIGTEAKRFVGKSPKNIRVIRPLKDGVIAEFLATKNMISYFIHKVLGRFLFIRPSMVICIPTGATQVEKRAVIESALQAGVREVKLIEEPMAAALGANLPITEPIGNLIIDIGGGTTEIALISLSSVSYGESLRVAGDAMNEAIQRYCHDELRLDIGESMAEEIKITIGAAEPLAKTISMQVSGKDLVTGIPRRIVMTDKQVVQALGLTVQQIVRSILKALESCPPELAKDIYGGYILMTGGGSLLRGLDEVISKKTNLKVMIDDDPLTTVVRGTGSVLTTKNTDVLLTV
ncbi:MAG: rod shape-determining protein [Desulfovibrionaceae bacterium]|nr:rod shape-determining protein [Desulfovibrionaceae bacterium]